MTKAEIIGNVAKAEGLPKAQATRVIENFFGIITESLQKGEKITIPGFGTFSPVARAARNGRNPRTGESLAIPATTSVKFKVGKTLNEAVHAAPAPGKAASNPTKAADATPVPGKVAGSGRGKKARAA